jgi:MFS family permease
LWRLGCNIDDKGFIPMDHRFSGLWRHADFMKLWTGQTVSKFGSTITREALPLTALLILGATPLQMGLLAAVATAPALLLGLVAGVWVDRLHRRPLMIAADLGRAALLLSITVAALLGRLSLEQLFVVAPLVGILTVFFDVAYQSFVPTLVERLQILEANSKLGVSGSLAEVTAPGVAGVLVQVATAPLALLIDAATFVGSALLLAAIRAPEPTPRPRPAEASARRELGEGLRFIAGHPILRALAAETATGSFFGNFFAGLYGLYGIRVLGLSPALLGISVAAGGAGDLIGALVAERTTRRLGLGATLLATMGIGALTGALVPLAGGPVVVATAMLVTAQLIGDGARSIFDIDTLSVRQSATPGPLLGRVNGGMYVLSAGVGPLGAVVGGLLAGMIGVRETLAIAVLGGSLAKLWIVFSPARSLRVLPAPEVPLESSV